MGPLSSLGHFGRTRLLFPRRATSPTTDSPVPTAGRGLRDPDLARRLLRKKWLRGQPEQPGTIDDLQALLDAFVEEYNDHRPHRSLPHRASPASVYTTLPKATPTTGDRDDDTHDRVRHDIVDKSGKVTWRYHGQMYSIGIGRTHARTRVLILSQDRDIRIVDAATGELIRELVLDPTKRYQPIPKPDTTR